MLRRLVTAALTGAFLVALGSGASAARPDDPANGCENQKSRVLAEYCKTNP